MAGRSTSWRGRTSGSRRSHSHQGEDSCSSPRQTARCERTTLRRASSSRRCRTRGAVRDAAFSADGRLVATTVEDSRIRIWDARTARAGPDARSGRLRAVGRLRSDRDVLRLHRCESHASGLGRADVGAPVREGRAIGPGRPRRVWTGRPPHSRRADRRPGCDPGRARRLAGRPHEARQRDHRRRVRPHGKQDRHREHRRDGAGLGGQGRHVARRPAGARRHGRDGAILSRRPPPRDCVDGRYGSCLGRRHPSRAPARGDRRPCAADTRGDEPGRPDDGAGRRSARSSSPAHPARTCSGSTTTTSCRSHSAPTDRAS